MPVNSFDDYPMSWKPTIHNKSNSMYKELAMQLESDIKEGVLKPGTMLPPQRELADFLDINLSTISRAFKLCEQKGLIYGVVGRGTFVESDATNTTRLLSGKHEERLIEMGAIMPMSSPNEVVLHMFQKLLKEPAAHLLLQYSLAEENLTNKDAAVKWLFRANFKANPELILFASAGQNALAGILTSLFRCGDKIGTNEVIYPGIKSLASMLGIKLIAIPEKEEEDFSDTVRAVCKREGLKGLYLIPDYSNPTTKTLGTKTRKEIAKIAQELDLIVIEDAINSLLRANPLPPIASYAKEQVIYLSSLSKTLSPGLRIAFVASPKKFYSELSFGFYNLNIMVSPFLLESAVRLILTEEADDILSKKREYTKKRNQKINEVLKDYNVHGDDYCNFRWLELPNEFSPTTFELCAKNAGVKLYGAQRFIVGNGAVPFAARIAVTAEKEEKDFERGLYVLRDILESKTGFTYF